MKGLMFYLFKISKFILLMNENEHPVNFWVEYTGPFQGWSEPFQTGLWNSPGVPSWSCSWQVGSCTVKIFTSRLMDPGEASGNMPSVVFHIILSVKQAELPIKVFYILATYHSHVERVRLAFNLFAVKSLCRLLLFPRLYVHARFI